MTVTRKGRRVLSVNGTQRYCDACLATTLSLRNVGQAKRATKALTSGHLCVQEAADCSRRGNTRQIYARTLGRSVNSTDALPDDPHGCHVIRVIVRPLWLRHLSFRWSRHVADRSLQCFDRAARHTLHTGQQLGLNSGDPQRVCAELTHQAAGKASADARNGSGCQVSLECPVPRLREVLS